MCEQILKFCSASTRPLLIVGSSLTLLLAIVLGYAICTTNALYKDIDPTVAEQRSLGYYLQLASAGLCFLVSLLGFYASNYNNQKHAIRALASLTAINFVLALAILAMLSSGQAETNQLLKPRLIKSVDLYDFAQQWPKNATEHQQAGNQSNSTPSSESIVSKSSAMATEAGLNPRLQRDTTNGKLTELSKENATAIWDSLQLQGCCGLTNATETWKKTIPKSCCSREAAITENGLQFCKAVDSSHKPGCLELISSKGWNLIILLALVALANFYLTIISGISAYRTFHYNEASQSAYN